MSEQYKKAGVNIEAGYEAVSQMKVHVQKTMRKEVLGSLGGFGATFDLSQLKLKEPILVSGTDGVGTKLQLAIDANKHDTIGIDAVAMCVNDVLTTGAEPLYFLDYIAVNQVVPEQVADLVKGVSEGCKEAGCALIGGETAEMGDMYEKGSYDIAGFSVGAVEKSKYVDFNSVTVGDTIIGLPSSGVHSNGYSLVRKIIKDHHIDLNNELNGEKLVDHLLKPTRIYVKPVLKLMEHITIKAMSHITGGGFHENIPRALPTHMSAKVDVSNVEVPAIIEWLLEQGDINREEAYHVFNMGIGFVIVVNKEDKETALQTLKNAGESPIVLGEVIQGEGLEING